MVLVIGLSAIVIGALGAAVGALGARYLPRVFLFVFWAMLFAGSAYLFLQGRRLDEFERISANMLVFAVLLPFLIGSLITGNLVRQRH